MSNGDQQSVAEFVDIFMQRIALGVFLVSLAYGASALIFVSDGEIASYLGKAKLGLGILAVILVLPQFIKMVRFKMKRPSDGCEPEGFVVDVYKRAAEKGFAFTFIFLLIMDVVTDKVVTDLPPKFFIEVVIAASLAIFSLSFFFLNRETDDREDDDDFDHEPGQ